ncbi:hypothetical protein P4132_28830 [Pseudomonas aeruginosa]|nr:hypothetical protein [Pseudomonas aeruginosa]
MAAQAILAFGIHVLPTVARFFLAKFVGVGETDWGFVMSGIVNAPWR